MDGSSDPFIAKFFSRIPTDVAESFTPAQLGAIKRAFGARTWGTHVVDIRKTITVPLIWRRIYFVLLMGGERRDDARLQAEGAIFGVLGTVLATVIFLAAILGPLALAIYAFKLVNGL